MRVVMRCLTGGVALVFLALGCGIIPTGEGERTDPTNGTGKTKDWAFTMTLTATSLTMLQGATDTVGVTIARTGGFTGQVNLEAHVPGQGGITVTVENITVTGTVTTARMIVQVGPNYPVGTGFGFGLGAIPASDQVQGTNVDVSLTILKKPGVFVANAATLSVGRGQTGGLRVSLQRTQFDAPVPMTLATTVAGITATFSPNPVIDTVTQMTINVDASVPEGVYSVGVRANEGLTSQATAPLALTVTPPGSFSINIPVSLLFVLRGSTTPVGLNIVRTNYTGPVSITVSGMPTGSTFSVVSPTISSSATMTFGSGTAPAGDYPLLFTAMGAGAPNATTTMTLRINP